MSRPRVLARIHVFVPGIPPVSVSQHEYTYAFRVLHTPRGRESGTRGSQHIVCSFVYCKGPGVARDGYTDLWGIRVLRTRPRPDQAGGRFIRGFHQCPESTTPSVRSREQCTPKGGWARSEPVANPRVGVWVKRCSDGRASRLPRLPAESQCSAAPRSLRTHQMLRRTRHTGSSAKVLSTLGGVLSLTRFAVAIFAQVHLRDCAKFPCQRRQTNVLHLCISGFVRLSVYSPGIPTTYRCICRITQY